MATEETAAARRAPPPRFDEAAFEQRKKAIKAQIDLLNKKKSGNQTSDNRNAWAELNRRREKLRDEAQELRLQKNHAADEYRKLADKARDMAAEARKESDEITKISRKLGHTSVDSIATDVDKLEKKLQAGLGSLSEEKKITNEISQLKRSQKLVAENEARRANNDQVWKTVTEARSQMTAANAKKNELIEQLNGLDSSFAALDEEKKGLSQQGDQLVSLKSQIDEQYDLMRSLISEMKQQKAERRQWEQEEYERRAALAADQRRQDELAKRTATAQREREMADIPAYTEEIGRCQSILSHLQSLSGRPASSSPVVSGNVRDYSNVTNLPEGAKLLKKNNDDAYMVLGGGKKDRKNRRNQANNAEDSSKSAAPKRVLRHDLVLVDQFSKLGIDLPTTSDQLPTAIKALEDKIVWYKEHQNPETERNKERAEARIKAILDAKTETPASADISAASGGQPADSAPIIA